ncbi:MAG: dihydropteroate synthase [Bacteroides sp.]|nr:dihydropteroate synthase [Bacteroides sp.]
MNRGDLTINIKGELMDFAVPKVMAIINVTPDSFFSGSRTSTSDDIRRRVATVREEGADILDIGGYSSRPGAAEVSPEEEYSRLARGMEVIRREWEDAVVSIDTFRSSVARRCIEEWGAAIINDISGGTLDPEMWEMAGSLKPVYVLMHMRGNPTTMQTMTDYDDVTAEVITDLSRKCYELRGLGVNDIIIDPGFGFAKTTDQNFRLLNELGEFCKMGMPVLAGVSRKSMIWKTLGITPEDSLSGTIALDAIALDRGADMIRVHDVKAAVETVKLCLKLRTDS